MITSAPLMATSDDRPATCATAILRAEHETILRMLDSTEAVARSLREGHPVTPEALFELVEFYHVFVDERHRGKEEDLLFPMLERKGVYQWEPDIIGANLIDHEDGGGWIGSLHRLARAYRQGHAAAGLRWAMAASNYVVWLRAHIESENQSLLPLADKLLTCDEQHALASSFAQTGTGRISPAEPLGSCAGSC